jgi:hypothetical protein
LDSVIKPYVKTDKFLLFLEPWGGQSNLKLYEEFLKKQPTCSLKITALKCIPLCQPYGMYFYRQVKNYIVTLHSCPVAKVTSGKVLTSLEVFSSVNKVKTVKTAKC